MRLARVCSLFGWLFAFLLTTAGADAFAQQTFRIQSRFKPAEEINVERGLASSATQPGWNSAMWIADPVGDGRVFVRIRNLYTKGYIRLNNGALEMAERIDPGWWDAMWEVESVSGTDYFRLRNRFTSAYLHNEGGALAAGTIQQNWWSAMWKLPGYTGAGANLADSQWMRKSREWIADKRLNQLVIPGTHDSATYNLTSTYQRDVSDPFAPDTDDLKRGLSFSGGISFEGWARAQEKTVFDQLRDGIRFLDIRVCADKRGELRACHGLYGAPLRDVLGDVARFAGEHPREVVIVLFQHLYDWGLKTQQGKGNDADFTGMLPANLTKLETMISQTLGNHLLPYTREDGTRAFSPASTLRQVWGQERTVIAVTDIGGHLKPTTAAARFFWPYAQTMNYKWYSEVGRDQFVADLAAKLSSGPSASMFLVTPFSVSPSHELYGKALDPTSNFPANLKQLAAQVNPVLLSYLTTDWKGMKANIVPTDHYQDSCLVPAVKSLNGIPADLSRCGLTRETLWSKWKLGIERLGEAIVQGTNAAVGAIVQAFSPPPLKPGTIGFYNGGGYNAQLTVSYMHQPAGVPIRIPGVSASNHLMLNQSVTLSVPADATDITVTLQGIGTTTRDFFKSTIDRATLNSKGYCFKSSESLFNAKGQACY